MPCKIEFNLITRVLKNARALSLSLFLAHTEASLVHKKQYRMGKEFFFSPFELPQCVFAILLLYRSVEVWLMLRGLVNPITDWLQIIQSGDRDIKQNTEVTFRWCASPTVKEGKIIFYDTIGRSPCTCLCSVVGAQRVFRFFVGRKLQQMCDIVHRDHIATAKSDWIETFK